MRRIGLFLLAVVMVAGIAGCGGGGGEDFSPTVSNMAGIYDCVEYTYKDQGGTTAVFSPPDYLETLELTAAGEYRRKATYEGTPVIDTSGTFSVSDSTIILVNTTTGFGATGTISEDGRKLTITAVEGDKTGTWEYTRS